MSPRSPQHAPVSNLSAELSVCPWLRRWCCVLGLLIFLPGFPGCGEKPETKTTHVQTTQDQTTHDQTTPIRHEPTEPLKPAAEKAAGPRVVEYGPGLRIDYRVPQIEVDCEVILREGDLELFCYSRAPIPKDHESILRTEVPAEAIFQALGLIGLAPGHPPKYFFETQTLRLPDGDPVNVLVRYESNDRVIEASACDWMFNVQANRPMARTHWLFAGSERMEDGAFAANYEGTVVTVVDFPSSLLSLPTSHSESDAELWLKAHTAVIPPLGTKVTMILRPVEPNSTE